MNGEVPSLTTTKPTVAFLVRSALGPTVGNAKAILFMKNLNNLLVALLCTPLVLQVSLKLFKIQ